MQTIASSMAHVTNRICRGYERNLDSRSPLQLLGVEDALRRQRISL